MIKEFLQFLKTRRDIKKEINVINAEENKSPADHLAMMTCEWVGLLWSGAKQKFLIHKTNFQELLTCGRFPNILYKFVNGIAETSGAEDLKLSEPDLKRMKEEEDEFLIELAKQSMVNPTYQECYDAILKIRGLTESNINDVIPQDFLNDLFLWYLNDWNDTLKKNLEKYNSLVSEGLQNTTDVDQANTSQA